MQLSTYKKPLITTNLKRLLKLNLDIIKEMSFQQAKISLITTIKENTSFIHISPLTNTITSYLIYTYNS